MTPHEMHVARAREAIEALRKAGAEKLPGRLQEAIETVEHDEMAAVLRQARAWAAYDPARDAARDAVALWWAVAGVADLSAVGRDLRGPG